MSAFYESLESRQFLSANPIGVKAPPQTIADDKAAIVAAQNQIKTDRVALAATLRDDRARIPAVRATDQALIRAAQSDLADARRSGNSAEVLTAQGDLLDARANLKSDVAAAQAQIITDAGQEKITLGADKTALTQARLKLREDIVAR